MNPGSFPGAMAQSNAHRGPEDGPIAGDLRTAAYPGKRVAEFAQNLIAVREVEEAPV